MFKFLQKCWMVTIQEKGSGDIVPNDEKFICRDYNAWSAWDRIERECKRKHIETGNPWKIVSIVRI